MNIISEYFSFPINFQQSTAFNIFFKCIKSEQSCAYILKGYAGTGKTTLISGFVKYLQKYKINFSLLASTGRASKVLSQITQKYSETIHSHLYVFDELSEDLETISKLEDDFLIDDNGQIRLKFGFKQETNNTKHIYIVDESSMISDVAEQLNSSFADFGSGCLLTDLINHNKNGIYIFVGDNCQLPPITQNLSPALDANYLKNKFNIHVYEYEMTEIVRQAKSNGIVTASINLRNLYKLNPLVKFASLPLKNLNNINILSTHEELIDRYVEQVKFNNFDDAIMICHSNKQCNQLNRLIRSKLYNEEKRVISGDLLIVTQNNLLTGYVNGEQLIVTNVGYREYRCGLTFLNIEIKKINSDIKHSVFIIEDLLYSNMNNLSSLEHKKLFIDFFRRMKELFKGKYSHYKLDMRTDPYLNALRVKFGFAVTCHKSQGGEWKRVFLYMEKSIHCLGKPAIYQWWYTAITRAKEKLYVVNDWFIK